MFTHLTTKARDLTVCFTIRITRFLSVNKVAGSFVGVAASCRVNYHDHIPNQCLILAMLGKTQLKNL